MTQKKKNNIIIGSLCAVVLLMVVGYAAFSSVLNIKGTSSISSNWNIKITKIEEKNIVGGAATATNATGDKKISGIGTLTASFETNLVSPGDSIEYDITVANEGTVNAKLDKITLTDSNNPAIKFTSSGLEEGSELNAGDTAILTVKVEYLNSVTSQPDDTLGTLTVTLDYSQKEGSGIHSGPLASETLIATAVSSGDGLYEDSTEPGRYIYKGANPNNYITFNEESWRILSVETNGTIKLMRNSSIGDHAFDSPKRTTGYCSQSSEGCHAWAAQENFIVKTYNDQTYSGAVEKDASLNTYLNTTYFNSLTEIAKNQVVSGIYNVGAVARDDDNDLSNAVSDEKKYTSENKIALPTATEYVKASNNSACTTVHSYDYGNSDCYNNSATHNWMYNIVLTATNKKIWLLTPSTSVSHSPFRADSYCLSGDWYNMPTDDSLGVAPVLYLNSNISLSGSGTTDDPYTIN